MTLRRKKVNLKDVAALAGVSTATVSRCFNHKGVVNQETYSRIMNAIAELEYEIPNENSSICESSDDSSSSLAKTTFTRDIILVNIPAISNPFYSDVILGIQSCIQSNNYELLLHTKEITENTLDEFLLFADSINVKGIITLTYVSEIILSSISKSFPVVQCCDYIDSKSASSVGIDDYVATQQALNYLLSINHKRIALVNGSLNFKYAQHRLEAYQKFIEANNLYHTPEWIIQLPDINPDMAFSSVVKLLSGSDAPDCFFAVSDILAATAIRAAQYCNYHVPDNISIVGFDNSTISQLTTPSITTINQPKRQLGYLACELLFEKINNPLSEIKHMKLSTELIIRESTVSF